MDKAIEAAKQAILAWMDSDEAFALSGISSDVEFDEKIAECHAKAAIAAYQAASGEARDKERLFCEAIIATQADVGGRMICDVGKLLAHYNTAIAAREGDLPEPPKD